MIGYVFEKNSDYCTLRFPSELAHVEGTDVEAVAGQVSQAVHNAPHDPVLVDLTQLQSLPDGFVALLVRTWKEVKNEGRRKFIVVSANSAVKEELQHTGLASLWTITDTLDEGYAALGVKVKAELLTDAHRSGEPDAPIVFGEQEGYCAVQFNMVAMSMNWADVESATTDVIEKLKQSKNKRLMVDLGRMDIINSGIVASLVRLYKTMQSRKGQFSLVSSNEIVTDVLNTAGLSKLFSVVEQREDAVYELGASVATEVEHRERRLLTTVSVSCAVAASLSLIVMFLKRTEPIGVTAHFAAVLLAAAAMATGLIPLFRDRGSRKVVSALAVLTAMGVWSTLWFKDNPLSFELFFPSPPGQSMPRDLEADHAAESGRRLESDEATDDNTRTEPDAPQGSPADPESSAAADEDAASPPPE